jgi:CheY-like chemotaxis protein
LVTEGVIVRTSPSNAAAIPSGSEALNRAGHRRITVVDHSDEFLDLLRDLFGATFSITGAHRVVSVNELADTAPDLLIVDLAEDGLGGLNGREILALARHHHDLCHVPIIVCTGDLMALMHDAEDLTAHGNIHLIAKPFELEGIEALVHRVLGMPRPLVPRH